MQIATGAQGVTCVQWVKLLDCWVSLRHHADKLSYRSIAARGRINLEQVEQSIMRLLAVFCVKRDDNYLLRPPQSTDRTDSVMS